MNIIERNSQEENDLLQRFLTYVKVDTEADPESSTSPSSEKQKELSKIIFEECKNMGLADVEMTKHGYVYATIPSTSDKEVPTICFCSHVDTAPDCSGANVKPIVHANYQGQDLVLPDDKEQIINPQNHKSLSKLIGDDIITASGLTLLGADDKSGVAIIMQFAQYMMDHPEILHGKIRLLFTTDEEIGHGVDHVDMNKLGAQFGYTLDGGETGSFEDETFSADAVKIEITGVSIHPGYAKGVMENSMKIAGEVLAQLPKERLSPESTSKKEGFVHPVSIRGELEKTSLDFIIRDFDTSKLKDHESELEAIVKSVIENYPNSNYTFTIVEQYRNMNEVLVKNPQVSDYAQKAIERTGLTMINQPIRGGTDGSRLSFMGMPCPNIFTGMHGIHSKQEWISLQDMTRAMSTIINLVQIWEEESPQ
jgi:tripeptide aminopeptidase